MSTTEVNFVVTETKRGPRIHRVTCTRQGNSATIAATAAFAPGTLAEATAATCCKPVGVKEAIRSAISEAKLAVTEPVAEPVAEPVTEPVTEPVAEVSGDGVAVAWPKLAKVFWNRLIAGAQQVSDALGGGEIDADHPTMTVYVDTEEIAYAVTGIWNEVSEEYRTHKKTDADSLALRAEGNGLKIRRAENAFLESFLTTQADALGEDLI